MVEATQARPGVAVAVVSFQLKFVAKTNNLLVGAVSKRMGGGSQA